MRVVKKLILKNMSNKRYSLILASILISIFAALHFTDAVVTSVMRSTTGSTRYRMSYTDIKDATDTTFGNFTSCKKLTLFTMASQNQILSLVSIVTTPFKLGAPDNNDKIVGAAIRPERNGQPIKAGGDIGNPPDLTPDAVPALENGVGSAQYAFFSDSETTDIVFTFCNFGSPGTFPGTASLDNLTQGEIDFYIYSIQ